MKRTSALALLIIFLTSTPFFTEGAAAQRRRRTARMRTPPTTECPVNIAAIADCPESGCGANGDVELNKAKNRTDIPSQAAVQRVSIASMQGRTEPASWNTGDDRTPITGTGKEGTAAELKGF